MLRQALAATFVVVGMCGSAIAADPAHVERLRTTNACVSCNLTGADLTRVNLTGANLSGADLTNANLSDANLAGANLAGANLRGADMSFTRLCNTLMPDGTINYADCWRESR